MVEIKNIVNVNFDVVTTLPATSSYPNILYVKKGDTTTEPIKSTSTYSVFTNICRSGTVYEMSANSLDGDDGTKAATKILDYKKSKFGTSEDFICVVIDETLLTTGSDNTHGTYYTLPGGLVSLTKDTNVPAPYKMMFFTSMCYDTAKIVTTDVTKPSQVEYAIANMRNVDCVGVMIYAGTEVSTKVPAMELAAYLCNINLDESSAFSDITYTDMSAVKTDVPATDVGSSYSELSKIANFNDIITKNFVLFGGNMTNGVPITTQFGAICAENDVVSAALNAMLNKLPLNDNGLATVVSYINDRLVRYINNGYLNQNTTYSGVTEVSSYNSSNVRLISRKQALPQGYLIATIPMMYLTATDRASKTFTPIYVYMETLSGARTIQINGKILA